MIPATAVAIPTAHTHRSPRRTTFSRTTYTIVRTPNVSAVHRDPYSTIPSADVSGAAYRRIASARPLSSGGGGTAAFHAVHHNQRERQLLAKVDIMEAKNRDLEHKLLDLKREMMMMKAENTSSSRLYPARANSMQRRQQQQQRSYSAAGVDISRRYAAAPSQRTDGLLSPPSRGRVAVSRAQPALQHESGRVEHTLHLVDELRDALLRGDRVDVADIPTAASKKTKKRKSSAKRSVSENAGEQLKHAIDHETARYNNERRYDFHRQTSAVETSRHERGDFPVASSSHGALRSPSRPPQRTAAISSSSIYDDQRNHQRYGASDDNDEAFESLQRSYWSQSQAILEELDRKLKSLDVTRSH
jgi:hypothetical protein